MSKDMEEIAGRRAEMIAGELYDLGYVIVPTGHGKPARRSKVEPAPDPGPWLGKSHTANLIGG
jgi:hypothetical protein